jgi:hypothetical protein
MGMEYGWIRKMGKIMSEPIDMSALLRPAVYLLFRDGRCVYVGQSKCPLVRVYTHRSMARRRKLPWIKTLGIVFDRFEVVPTRVEDLTRVEAELIAKFSPEHNVRIPPIDVAAWLGQIEHRPLITRRLSG